MINKIFIIFICILVGASCKKSKDKTPVCNITEVNSTRSQQKLITYNNVGKPVTIISGTSKVAFTYAGNTVTVLLTNNNLFQVRYIITVKNNGLAETVRTELDEAGTQWYKTVYLYNGEELTKSTNITPAGTISSVTSYTWAGGNPVSRKSNGGEEMTMEYYTDKPFSKALELVAGVYWESLRPKNLEKKIIIGPDHILRTYDFDAEGKVLSVTITGNATPTTTNLFTYDCTK